MIGKKVRFVGGGEERIYSVGRTDWMMGLIPSLSQVVSSELAIYHFSRGHFSDCNDLKSVQASLTILGRRLTCPMPIRGQRWISYMISGHKYGHVH